MSGHVVLPRDHEKREWFRLTSLYDTVAVQLITDINAVLMQKDDSGLEKAVDRVVISIGSDSARTYGLPFKSREYLELSNEAADRIGALLSPKAARQAVRRIFPPNLNFALRQERENMPGLDAAGAVRVEKYRQAHPDDRQGAFALMMSERVKRVNLISRTEVVKIGSDVLDYMWLSNMSVQKAVDRPLILSDLAISGGTIPPYARKVWVTRKDGRVCQYCEPLSGLTTGVGQYFNTIYGRVSGPPIHPQCRCVPALTVRGKLP